MNDFANRKYGKEKRTKQEKHDEKTEQIFMSWYESIKNGMRYRIYLDSGLLARRYADIPKKRRSQYTPYFINMCKWCGNTNQYDTNMSKGMRPKKTSISY